MKRTRLLALAWIFLNLFNASVLVPSIAATIELELTKVQTFDVVLSILGAVVAGWFLRGGKTGGWYLLLFLLITAGGMSIIDLMINPGVELGETAFGLLILSAFTYQLNHSNVRAYVNLEPTKWPQQGILYLVTRVVMYSAGAVLLAELFLGWEIGGVLLLVLLSREFYRTIKYGVHGAPV